MNCEEEKSESDELEISLWDALCVGDNKDLWLSNELIENIDFGK
jgi:hypothetical protein